jgi:membrane protein implicated in regulation of membrane protease activity
MIILGVILLILGLVLPQSILTTIGIILIVVGLVLNLVPIGGSKRRVF